MLTMAIFTLPYQTIAFRQTENRGNVDRGYIGIAILKLIPSARTQPC